MYVLGCISSSISSCMMFLLQRNSLLHSVISSFSTQPSKLTHQHYILFVTTDLSECLALVSQIKVTLYGPPLQLLIYRVLTDFSSLYSIMFTGVSTFIQSYDTYDADSEYSSANDSSIESKSRRRPRHLGKRLVPADDVFAFDEAENVEPKRQLKVNHCKGYVCWCMIQCFTVYMCVCVW